MDHRRLGQTGLQVSAWCLGTMQSGKTAGQTALAWLLTSPVVTTPVLGINSVDQLRESLGATGCRLAPDEMARRNDLTRLSRNCRPIRD